MLNNLNKPLSSAEIVELAEYLESIPNAMSLEMLDGFFTALVCSPELVPPSVYVSYIWSDNHDFKTTSEAQKYFGYLVRHWNSITSELHSYNSYDPLLVEYEDDSKTGNEWAVGFMQGIQIGGEAWQDLIDDDETGSLLVPILALANENNPDPEFQTEPIDEEKREMMLNTIPALLPVLYKYFMKHRQDNPMPSKRMPTPVRTSTKKVGRNEPCPCGSLRKYKQCCGKN